MASSLPKNNNDLISNWLIANYCSHAEQESKSDADKKSSTLDKTQEVYYQVLGEVGEKFLEGLFNEEICFAVINQEKLHEYVLSDTLPASNKDEKRILAQLAKHPIKIKRLELRDYIAGILVRKGLMKFPEGSIDGGVTRRSLIPNVPFADLDIGFYLHTSSSSDEIRKIVIDCVAEKIKSILQTKGDFKSPNLLTFIKEVYLREPYPIYDNKSGHPDPIGWVITVQSDNALDIDLKFIIHSSGCRSNVATRDGFRLHFEALSPTYHVFAVDNRQLCNEATFRTNFQHLNLNISVIRDRENVFDLFFRVVHDMDQGTIPSTSDAQFAVNQAVTRFVLQRKGDAAKRYQNNIRNCDEKGIIVDFLNSTYALSINRAASEADEKAQEAASQQNSFLIEAFAKGISERKGPKQHKAIAIANTFSQLSKNPKLLKPLLDMVWGGYFYQSRCKHSFVDFEYFSHPDFPELTANRIIISPKGEGRVHYLVIPPISQNELISRFMNSYLVLKAEMGLDRLLGLMGCLGQKELVDDINQGKIAMRLLGMFDHSQGDLELFQDQMKKVFPETSNELFVEKRRLFDMQRALREARECRDNLAERLLIAIQTDFLNPERQIDLTKKLLSLWNAPIDFSHKPNTQHIIVTTCMQLCSNLSPQTAEDSFRLMLRIVNGLSSEQQSEVGQKFREVCEKMLNSNDYATLLDLTRIVHACFNQSNPFISDGDLEALKQGLVQKLRSIATLKSADFANVASLSISLECMRALALLLPKKTDFWNGFVPVIERAFSAAKDSKSPNAFYATGCMALLLMEQGVTLKGIQSHHLLHLAIDLFNNGSIEVSFKNSRHLGNRLLSQHMRSGEVDEKWKTEARQSLLNRMVTVLDQPSPNHRLFTTLFKQYAKVQPMSPDQQARFVAVGQGIKDRDNQIVPLFIRAMVLIDLELAIDFFKRLRNQIASAETDRKIDAQLHVLTIMKHCSSLDESICTGNVSCLEESLKNLGALLQDKNDELSSEDTGKIHKRLKSLLFSFLRVPNSQLPRIEDFIRKVPNEFLSDDERSTILSQLHKLPIERQINELNSLVLHKNTKRIEDGLKQLIILFKNKNLTLSGPDAEIIKTFLDTFLSSFVLAFEDSQSSLIPFIEELLTETHQKRFIDDETWISTMVALSRKSNIQSKKIKVISHKSINPLNQIVRSNQIRMLKQETVFDLLNLLLLEEQFDWFRLAWIFVMQNTILTRLQIESIGLAMCLYGPTLSEVSEFISNRVKEYPFVARLLFGAICNQGVTKHTNILKDLLKGGILSVLSEEGLEAHLIFFQQVADSFSFQQPGKSSKVFLRLILEIWRNLATESNLEVLPDNKKIRETRLHVVSILHKEGSLDSLKEICDIFLKDCRYLSKECQHFIVMRIVQFNSSTKVPAGFEISMKAAMTLAYASVCKQDEDKIKELLSAILATMKEERNSQSKDYLNILFAYDEVLLHLILASKRSLKPEAEQHLRDLHALFKNVPTLQDKASLLEKMLKHFFTEPKPKEEDSSAVAQTKYFDHVLERLNTISIEAKMKREVVLNLCDKKDANIIVRMASFTGIHKLDADFNTLSEEVQKAKLQEMAIYFKDLITLISARFPNESETMFLIAKDVLIIASEPLANIPGSPLRSLLWSVLDKAYSNLVNGDPQIFLRFFKECIAPPLSRMEKGEEKEWAETVYKMLFDLLPKRSDTEDEVKESKEIQIQVKDSSLRIDSSRVVQVYEFLFAIIQSPLLAYFIRTQEGQNIFSRAIGILFHHQLMQEITNGKSDSRYRVQGIILELMKKYPRKISSSDETDTLNEFDVIFWIIKEIEQLFVFYPYVILKSNRVKRENIAMWNSGNIDSIVDKMIKSDKQLEALYADDPSIPIGMLVEISKSLTDEEQRKVLSKEAETHLLKQAIEILQNLFSENQLFYQGIILNLETNRLVACFMDCTKKYIEIMCYYKEIANRSLQDIDKLTERYTDHNQRYQALRKKYSRESRPSRNLLYSLPITWTLTSSFSKEVTKSS